MSTPAYERFNQLNNALFKCVNSNSATTMSGMSDMGKAELCKSESTMLTNFLKPGSNDFTELLTESRAKKEAYRHA